MKKSVKWTNKFFEVEFYNTGILSIQLALFIGLAATWLFATQETVKSLCLVFFIIDVLVNLYVLISTSTFESTDSENNEKKDVIETKVETSTKKETSTEKKKEPKERKGSNTINNKVPVPNPPKQKENKEEENVTKSVPQSNTSVPDARVPKGVAEMTDADWDAVWKI